MGDGKHSVSFQQNKQHFTNLWIKLSSYRLIFSVQNCSKQWFCTSGSSIMVSCLFQVVGFLQLRSGVDREFLLSIEFGYLWMNNIVLEMWTLLDFQTSKVLRNSLTLCVVLSKWTLGSWRAGIHNKVQFAWFVAERAEVHHIQIELWQVRQF